MGQQQLLLLVLGIVIVGIAIVVGISAYSENNVKANFDALMTESIGIASKIQTWKQKPEVFRGSPDDTKVDPLDFTAYGDGTPSCSSRLDGSFVVDGSPPGGGALIVGYNSSLLNYVVIEITGTTDQDIEISDWAKGGVDENGSPVTGSKFEEFESMCSS